MSDLTGKHKVLHVTVEMAPLEKQGGLGDVLGSLPKALCRRGVDARVLMPLFPGMLENIDKYRYNCVRLPHKINVALDWRVYSASILQVDVEGIPVYLLDQPELFVDPKVYPMNLTYSSVLPFVFLSLAALELPGCTDWKPDILHVHDWSTTILPIALKWHRHYKDMRSSYDVVLTIHNLAHQGVLDSGVISSWGLMRDAYSINGMEFYGQANILKGGAYASDVITTVSPHYSWDITTPDGGSGLNGVFSSLRGKLTGILNGIDYDVWSPATDKMLPARYSIDDMSGKTVCREKLFEMCNWQDDGKPVAVFVGRLVQQKGVDIMLTALDWLMVDNCRAVVIGSGEAQYEAWVHQFSKTYPDYFWCFTGFNEEMAHLAYAGADMLLMPSLFEPCGLSQMIAMAYGTVPVVRSTGGLADTVIDFDGSVDGTGFLFSDYKTDELAQAITRAIDAYDDKSRWNQVVKNAMRADFSWDSSTTAYIRLYDNLRSGDSLV